MEKRKKKLHNKVTFKPYNQYQTMLLPPSLDSLIKADHPVRVVDRVIESLNLAPLLASYAGGGSSSYHPKMLLKVWVYGYLRNIYSSRKIETALEEHIHFMWLSGMQYPDHNTLNDFRSKRLNNQLKEIFSQVVLLLVAEGFVDIKDIYTDGTKLEANANRYTFVWAKAIKTNKEKIKAQLEDLWSYVEQSYEKDAEQTPAKPNFAQLSPEQVEQTIASINTALEGKVIDKKKAAKLKYAAKNWSEKLKDYEEKEELLAGRGSYSKTDTDATFMRMKEDHMKNGQLKAGYNVQFSTNDKFVVNYTVGQHPTDTVLYPTHLEEYYKQYGSYPDSDTADAGYGSEENYELLEKNGIAAFVKYGSFHGSQKKNFKLDPSKKENLHYNQELNCFYCPMGQTMDFVGTLEQTTKTGFKQSIHKYQARNCKGCPMQGRCHKSKYNRTIYLNWNLERHKRLAQQRLQSELGKEKRGQRCVDVEGTFGQLKQNKGFRRFLLRGLDKVNIEIGLLALSMNLDRMVKKKKQLLGEVCPPISETSQNPPQKEINDLKRA